MTAPARATTADDGSRFYTLADGTRLLSVTTVLHVLDKPALLYWAAKQVAEYAVEIGNLPPHYEFDRAAAVADLKRAPWRTRDTRAVEGVDLHDFAEAAALGKPMPEPTPTQAPFVKSLRRFLDDHAPQFEASEMTVVNRTCGYAGTLDGIAHLPLLGETLPVVLDYKTAGRGPYREWALQLAAYSHAETALLPDGTEPPMPDVSADRAAVVVIRPRSYQVHVADNLADHFAAFLRCLDLVAWRDGPGAKPFTRHELPEGTPNDAAA